MRTTARVSARWDSFITTVLIKMRRGANGFSTESPIPHMHMYAHCDLVSCGAAAAACLRTFQDGRSVRAALQCYDGRLQRQQLE